MTSYLWVRYAHFISILIFFAMLVAQNMLLKKEMNKQSMLFISRLDAMYGLVSITAVVTGLAMWLWLGKPASFYVNWIFYTKLGVITLIGILSSYPTIFFLKNRSRTSGDREEQVVVPNLVLTIVRIELILLLFMPLLATLMAAGVGQF